MRRRVALERELRVLRRGGQGGEATPGDDASDVSVDSLDGGDGSDADVRASTLRSLQRRLRVAAVERRALHRDNDRLTATVASAKEAQEQAEAQAADLQATVTRLERFIRVHTRTSGSGGGGGRRPSPSSSIDAAALSRELAAAVNEVASTKRQLAEALTLCGELRAEFQDLDDDADDDLQRGLSRSQRQPQRRRGTRSPRARSSSPLLHRGSQGRGGSRQAATATATAGPDRPRTQSRARPLSREEKQRRYLSLLHEAKAPHASPVRGAALRAMDVGLGSDADDSGNEAGHGDLPTTRDDLIAALRQRLTRRSIQLRRVQVRLEALVHAAEAQAKAQAASRDDGAAGPSTAMPAQARLAKVEAEREELRLRLDEARDALRRALASGGAAAGDGAAPGGGSDSGTGTGTGTGRGASAPELRVRVRELERQLASATATRDEFKRELQESEARLQQLQEHLAGVTAELNAVRASASASGGKPSGDAGAEAAVLRAQVESLARQVAVKTEQLRTANEQLASGFGDGDGDGDGDGATDAGKHQADLQAARSAAAAAGQAAARAQKERDEQATRAAQLSTEAAALRRHIADARRQLGARGYGEDGSQLPLAEAVGAVVVALADARDEMVAVRAEAEASKGLATDLRTARKANERLRADLASMARTQEELSAMLRQRGDDPTDTPGSMVSDVTPRTPSPSRRGRGSPSRAGRGTRTVGHVRAAEAASDGEHTATAVKYVLLWLWASVSVCVISEHGVWC